MCTEQFIRRSIHLTWILSQLKSELDWGVVSQFGITDFSEWGRGATMNNLNNPSYILHPTV